MPLVRFKIRNELSLGGLELNRSAAVENEEPKAILGAVEVAGLIGILRQLGDLAEFSAEVFNGIQEEVTSTASRCQKLTSRVRRIESALSPLEKAVLSQTSHIHFAYTAGCEWHPRTRNGHSHFIQSDLPLCVMETYEQCRDPPPLHLLDRFDVSGPGSCLRKYSDPTFFRKELSKANKGDDIKVQRDHAHHKRKKKRLPQRNICRSRAVSTSEETNGARLSSATDGRQTTSQSTSTFDMPRSSNMQDLSDIIDQSHLQGQSDALEESEGQVQSDFRESSKPRDSITGSGYIEYVISQNPVTKPEVMLVDGFLSGSLQPADRIGSAVPEGCNKDVNGSNLYSTSEDLHVPCASIVCDEKKETVESMVGKSRNNEEEIQESKLGPGTPDRVRKNQWELNRTNVLFGEVDTVGEKQSESQANTIVGSRGIENEGENKSEQGSEADEFLDARNTIESESDSDLDGVPKPKLEQYFGDISTYCSEDATSDNNDGSEDMTYDKMSLDPRYENSFYESCSGPYLPKDANVSCCLSEPVDGKTLSHVETSQNPMDFFAMWPSLLAKEAFPDVTSLREEPVVAHPLLEVDCANEKISSQEPILAGPYPNDALPAEKILPEEHLANYPALTEAAPREKILPGESVAEYPSLEENVPHENLLEKSLPEILSFAEAVRENRTIAEEPDAAHPYFPETVQGKKISTEVLDWKTLSVPERVLHQQISLEDYVGIHPCMKKAVHDERLPKEKQEKPATTCLSLKKALPTENLLPEEPLEAYHYLEELPKEKISQEKSVDSTHPYCAEVAPEANIPPEVLDSANLYVAEVVPCLEAFSDDRFLSEEPVTSYLSLTKAVAMEKVLPEELIETCPLEELPEEISDSTNLCLGEGSPQEQISGEEFVSINPCLAEAVPNDRILSEEPVSRCLSLTKAAAIEGVLRESPMETYSYLVEFPEEKIMHEEADDVVLPPLSEAVIDEQISLKVIGSTTLPVAEAVGTDPCLAEAALDKMVLPEEPVPTCMPLTKAVPMEEVLPEEPLEAYATLEKLPNDKISHEKSDDATYPYCANSNENVSPEDLDSTNLYVAEAIPQEQIVREEVIGIDPSLAEAVPDERILSEEPLTTCLSLTKARPYEKILPEEPVEVYPSLEELLEEKIPQEEEPDDATQPSFSEAVNNEKISPVEGPGSTYPSLEESVPHEKTSYEELFGAISFLELAVPIESGFQGEPGIKYQSSTEAVLKEKTLPEYPLPTYSSLAEALPDEKISFEEPDVTCPPSAEVVPDENISFEEPDVTCPPSAEAVFDENISDPEAPSSSIETDPENKTFPEKPVAKDLSLTAVVSDENIAGPEAPNSSIETDPGNKTFSEEPVAKDLSLTADVSDENIPGSKAPGSATENGPHNKTIREEPVAKDLPLAAVVSDENIPGSEAPGSTTESGPSLAEPVPDDTTLTKGPAAAYLAEGIPDEKVFLDDAAFLSFAEAIFAQKFSPEVPDSTYTSLTEPEMPVALPAKNIWVKEGEAYDEQYTASDVSTNQNSDFLEPKSADKITTSSGVRTVKISPDTQESLSNGTSVESVSIWSNGGLLGLAPSKPPVFAAPNSVSEHLQNGINEASVLTTRKQESSSRPVEDTGKSPLSLVVSDTTAQQHSKVVLSPSNGSHSLLQSTTTSLRAFGLSHRLLMAGFRGNSSSTCKFESLPTTIYDTKVAAIEDKIQHTPGGSRFEEQWDYESSLFGSPTSSPPVEHMKIAFNPIDAPPVSKLKLKIPCQPQYPCGNADMFPSFQLVPEAGNFDDEDNKSDIFCQSSSPCVSDNSDSELWESDESPRKSESSLKQFEDRSRHGYMGSFSGPFLDLPCFDSVGHQSTSSRVEEQEQEQEQVAEYKPTVSEIIRDWPPNKPKSSPSEQ